MKQNGNFRSSALLCDYYNIYNIVSDDLIIYLRFTTVNVKLSAGQDFSSPDMWS